MEEKKLIILAMNLNVDGHSRQRVEENIFQLINHYNDKFSTVKGYDIQMLYIPVTNQETKIYCVYSDAILPEKVNENLKEMMVEVKKMETDSLGQKLLKKMSKTIRFLKLSSIFKS